MDGTADDGYYGAVLAEQYVVPDVTLTDDGGAPYNLRTDTTKPLTLLFYGYTHCPDICGTVMSSLASSLTRLDDDERDQVQVVFITTDPARDDAETLRRYVGRYDPTFIGLTGSIDDISTAGDAMGVFIAEGHKLPSGGYDVSHGTGVVAVDSQRPFAYRVDRRHLVLAVRIRPRPPARPSAGGHVIPALSALTALTIPSPSEGVWHVGSVPIRAYALCIIVGIIVAIIVSERRWVARGGRYGDIQDLALWAVPFGLVGGRLYHVATDYELYFGDDKNPVTALYVWRGGLGIWGAIALGAVGVWIGARRKGIKVLPVMDAMAPGAVLAQAIGRWGNYFNQELYGRTTDLPWKLEITKDANGDPVPATYHHPTFLYEFIWDLGVFGLLVWADRRFKLGFGRVVALYIVGYTAGRAWIEDLRVDEVQLNDVLGLRLNVWTSIVLFVVGAAWFALERAPPSRPRVVRLRRPGHRDRQPTR